MLNDSTKRSRHPEARAATPPLHAPPTATGHSHGPNLFPTVHMPQHFAPSASYIDAHCDNPHHHGGWHCPYDSVNSTFPHTYPYSFPPLGVSGPGGGYGMANGPVPDLDTIISLHGVSRSEDSAFGTPSTERTLYTPSVSPNCTIYPSEPTNSSESMRQQSVLKSCISNDPDILRLAEIVTRDKFLVQPPEDLLIAQFYSIKRVPGTSQPKSNKKKATANVRPVNLLEYNCLWCIKWIGYSKEKARNHILSHLEIKNARCQEPGCNWSSVRRSDLVRHLQVTHNQSKSGKKSGGPMRATPSFLELQGVYKFNTETILANAESCSTSPSYYQPDLMQWITYIPDTNENRPMSTAHSQ